jgi:hypothetical protein
MQRMQRMKGHHGTRLIPARFSQDSCGFGNSFGEKRPGTPD